MTTLVLGLAGAAIGGFIGGPLGASIGWSLGSLAGSALDPQRIEGPKLADRKLQTSAYGTAIPIVYGSYRLAGAVIWQTDLVEHEQKSGGKGGPETTTYTYSASYAILICEGEAQDLRRIWADGRLIRDPDSGAADLPITIYLGSETQLADPTIEAAEGVGEVPAHRGSVYVVFTDHYLTDFGNRIPNLEFEVVFGTRTNCPLVQTVYLPTSGEWHATGQMGGGNNGAPGPYIDSWNPSTPTVEPVVSASVPAIVSDGGGTGQYAWAVTIYPGPMHRIGDLTLRMWMQQRPIGTNPQDDFALGAGTVSIEKSGPIYIYHESHATIDVGISCGIPVEHAVQGTVGSVDNIRLFVFTRIGAAGGDFLATHWWELVNGKVQRSGTVSPSMVVGNGPFSSAGAFGFGPWEAENNGRYFWAQNGTASPGGVSCYHIDDAGNLAQICSTLAFGEERDDANNLIFTMSGAVRAAEGQAVFIGFDHFHVVRRYPLAQDESVTLESIVADISERDGFGNAQGLTAGQVDATALTDLVAGYCVSAQMDKRAALQPLRDVYAFDAAESDGAVVFVKRGGAVSVTIPDDDLAAHEYGGELPALVTIAHGQEDDLPRSVAVGYVNQATDYQPGLQLAQRQTGRASRDKALQFAVVLTDIQAKQVADALLYDGWSTRDVYKFATSRKYLAIDPADVVSVDGRTLRVLDRNEGATGVLTFTAVPSVSGIWLQSGVAGDGGGGFVVTTPPAVHDTELRLLAIPVVDDADPRFGFYVAMADNAGSSWPGASLYISKDAGLTWAQLALVVHTDTFGTASTTLGNFGGGNIFDELNTVTVVLTAGAGDLASASELAVLNGANLAALGAEIIQYKTATLTAASTYKLSGLLRGRLGTESAISTHAAAEEFCALPTETTITSGIGEVGKEYSYKAVTNGTPIANAAAHAFTNTGAAARPYSAVQLGGGRNSSDDVILTWVRRERIGGEWLDYADVAQEDVPIEWALSVWSSNSYATLKRAVTIYTYPGDATTYTYTAALQTTDFGSAQATLYWSVKVAGPSGFGTDARGTT